MLLAKLVRFILNGLRHEDCKGAPMTKDEAATLIKKKAADHPEGAELDTSKSIVDACKALGLDASMSARKRYAQEFRISPYDGTAEQNQVMLDKLLVKVAENDVDSLRD